jgi:hypothetical protein
MLIDGGWWGCWMMCDILIELILLGYKYVMVCGDIGWVDIDVDIF